MGVVDLETVRVHRLADQLAGELQAAGAVWAAAEEVDDVDRWRRAARQAGRGLGWSVRTGVTDERVWAVSEDYEPPLDADRDAALRFAHLLAGPRPPDPSPLDAKRRGRRHGGRGRTGR
jgi:hypothetical protein